MGHNENVMFDKATKRRFRLQMLSNITSKDLSKQDHHALLKAKYCPRVAAASRTQ